MNESARAKERSQQFFLEAAQETDDDQAKLLVCVATVWLDVLSVIEGRTVSAEDVVSELLNARRAKERI